MKCMDAIRWQSKKFDMIQNWYRTGKINFATKLKFQLAVTNEMYRKME